MKTILAGLMLAAATSWGAEKSHPVRGAVDFERRWYHFRPAPRYPATFRMELVSDTEGVKPESVRRGRPFVAARDGENYSIRLHNPLPVRVAVNLTVDGLNSITGKPSGIADGAKWMIEPHGTIEIRGWQVNGAESRRFFFTDKPKSYANWRGERLGRDLAANCGVIGAAFFWNQAELDRAYRPVPEPYASPAGESADDKSASKPSGAMRQEAGTGMGEREYHPTTSVEFAFDAGMYRPSDALLIYYDFAAPEPVPNAFPALSFAPEMP